MQAEELSRFINETSKPQANYQYVVIKTLLENSLSATKEQILEKLEYYNSDKVPQKYRENGVFDILQKKLVITTTQKGVYDLNLTRDTDSKKILKLISDCNKKIWQDKLSSSDIFIALGPWENWDYTINHLPLRWGVSDISSNIDVYQKLEEGDLVFYYPTQADPKFFNQRGFFGVGVVTRKENKRTGPYWPAEIKNNRLFFTNELYLDTLVFVDKDDELLPIESGLPLIKGLNHVNPGSPLNNLLLHMKNKWNISLNPTVSEDVNYWKIAPGKNAKNWERQKNQKIIGVGWNELGDLTGLTEEQVSQRVSDKFQSARSVILTQLEYFLKIKKGDIVIANKGKSRIVGIGRVIGDYKYASDQEYGHTYPVDWFWTGEKEIPFQDNWFVTVIPIPIELYKIIVPPKQLLKTNLSPKLEDLIEKFDKNPKGFEISNWTWTERKDRERYYERFVTKFPAEKIDNLTIEQYVLGILDEEEKINQETFSYYLERRTPTTGNVYGGNAEKFGIYYNREKQKKFVYSNSYSNENDAFNAIKHAITVILFAGKKYIDDKDSEKLSDIVDAKGQNIHRHIRSKILSTYYPDSFLLIHSNDKIDLLLDYFDIPKAELEEKLTMKQLKLLDIKDRHSIMKDWDVYKYSMFLFIVIIPLAEKKDGKSTDDEKIDSSIDDNHIRSLTLPQGEGLAEIKKEIQKTLLVSDRVIERIIASLYAGKHVLLIGPVGTGKTDLARKIPKSVWNYYPEIHTATSDWTTHDVIGGLFPKIEGNDVKFKVQKGCVSSTVSKNWSDYTGQRRIRSKYKHRNPETGKIEVYNGVWLVLDEFNRANIDRAFGQLFTALEYRNELKVPTEKTEKETDGEFFEKYVIPEDYRIIGTLNSHDKHFLFHLSDALKRRFDFIEISVPTRKQKDAELEMVFQKATYNTPLNVELASLRNSHEKIDEKLYEIMSFIRKSKQLGTALLISIFKDMLVYHQMGNNYDQSLDSALTKKILPQLEGLPVSTLRILKRFVHGTISNFYIDFSIDEHEDKIEDYAKELEVYKKYFKERFGKEFAENWIDKFRQRSLSKFSKIQNPNEEQDKEIKLLKMELNPWNENITAPNLPYFTKALKDLIEEKEFTMINTLESNLN